jgi:hypothetical protein
MRHRIDLIALFVCVTILCVVVVAALPGDQSIIYRVYILVVGALVLLGIHAEIGVAFPGGRHSELTRALNAPQPEPMTVPELAKLEREVTLAVGNAYTWHTRLLPQLREIAEARLEATGRRPGPETLGRWWDLLGPDLPEPADHFAPGIRAADLRALVADLERM